MGGKPTGERDMNGNVRYRLSWEYFDVFSDCEYVRSAYFGSVEEAENFARNNELGCWWVNEVVADGE